MAGQGKARFFGPMLIAGDFAATVAFYRDRLRLEVDGESPYAECRSASSIFCIVDGRFWGRVHGSETDFPRAHGGPAETILVIQVDNVEATFERLMSEGVKFLSPPTDRPPMGLRNALVRDPDGRTVEITSPLPARSR